MTLIFTDEPDESFTGAGQPANGVYQQLLKISGRSTNRGTNPANTNLAIADGARQQIGSTLFYDPAYVQLTYPAVMSRKNAAYVPMW